MRCLQCSKTGRSIRERERTLESRNRKSQMFRSSGLGWWADSRVGCQACQPVFDTWDKAEDRLILELSSDYHTCTVVFVNIYIQYIKISAKSLKSPVIISMGLIGWNFRIDMCGPEASLAYTEKPCFKKLKTNKQIKNTPPLPTHSAGLYDRGNMADILSPLHD